MLEPEEAPIQSDSYIEALLEGHARRPLRLPYATGAPSAGIRHAVRVIERGLPRFHPSFLFEEHLAQELRAAAGMAGSGVSQAAFAMDRRVVMGGAIASSVSIAGAAVLAWRRRRI